MAKANLVTIRMDDTEEARASAVATHYGLPVSNVVRMLLKREARDLGLEPSAKAAKTTTAK